MLDGEACIELAVEHMRAAAAEGAQLIVLPECFVPFYPKSWLTVSNWGSGQTALYERMWMNAVSVPGPHTDRLAAACPSSRYTSRSASTSARARPGDALQHFAPIRSRRHSCAGTASSCRPSPNASSAASATATTCGVTETPLGRSAG